MDPLVWDYITNPSQHKDYCGCHFDTVYHINIAPPITFIDRKNSPIQLATQYVVAFSGNKLDLFFTYDKNFKNLSDRYDNHKQLIFSFNDRQIQTINVVRRLSNLIDNLNEPSSLIYHDQYGCSTGSSRIIDLLEEPEYVNIDPNTDRDTRRLLGQANINANFTLDDGTVYHLTSYSHNITDKINRSLLDLDND